MTNVNEITREHVLHLMMEDGWGPDEVLSNSAAYCMAITGHDTPTGRMRVETIARALIREARQERQRYIDRVAARRFVGDVE